MGFQLGQARAHVIKRKSATLKRNLDIYKWRKPLVEKYTVLFGSPPL